MFLFFARLLARLPLWLLHGIGSAMGWAVYLGSPRYRARLQENLASSGVCAGEDCQPLRRRAVAEAGKSALETFAVWLRPQDKALHLLRETRGWEHVEAALQAGRGIIFLTPHMGCFEITSLYYAARHPITVLYRPPKLRFLQPLLEAGRTRGQVTLAPTDMSGVKALLKALKRGEAAGILPDQVPGQGEGVWAEFFGRPAYTMTLAPRLARSTGAAVILAYAERLSWGRGFVLWLEPLKEAFPEDQQMAARVLNRAIEQVVRKNPTQYLWSYNRYKVPRGATPPDAE